MHTLEAIGLVIFWVGAAGAVVGLLKLLEWIFE